jgi:DNA polymerase-1
MSGVKDPWGNGFNPQTAPKEIRKQFLAPGNSFFIEVDLKQAENRFVAWAGPVPRLMELFNSGVDVHKYVASMPGLFNKPIDQITNDERQLGKKTGHAANYGMGPKTLAEQCLLEMDLVISESKAEMLLEGYHGEFPEIRSRYQKNIEIEVNRSRRLRSVLGRERVFYGRFDDALLREAYAYKPQATVTDCINHLVLHMFGRPGVKLIVQVHDSLLMEVAVHEIESTLELIKDQNAWNPNLELPGGKLQIPIEIKLGKRWGELREVFSG